MPYSTSKFKNEIKSLLIEKFPDRETTIVDVGAGAGSYADLLGGQYRNIDAVEIWRPYIAEFGLAGKYRNVFCEDASDFFRKASCPRYDVAILGDVLEHLAVNEAADMIERCVARCGYVLVIVPFSCEQEESHGNHYERHLQPDLTFETMSERYGEYLELLMHGFHSSDNEYEIAVYQSKDRQAWVGGDRVGEAAPPRASGGL